MKNLISFAAALLLCAPLAAQVKIHRGGTMPQAQATDFDVIALLIVTVGQANSGNQTLGNLAEFPGDTDDQTFTDANAVRLSSDGLEPPSHYAVLGRYKTSRLTALQAAFGANGPRRGWYNETIATDASIADPPLFPDIQKVLAIISGLGLQRIQGQP